MAVAAASAATLVSEVIVGMRFFTKSKRIQRERTQLLRARGASFLSALFPAQLVPRSLHSKFGKILHFCHGYFLRSRNTMLI